MQKARTFDQMRDSFAWYRCHLHLLRHLHLLCHHLHRKCHPSQLPCLNHPQSLIHVLKTSKWVMLPVWKAMILPRKFTKEKKDVWMCRRNSRLSYTLHLERWYPAIKKGEVGLGSFQSHRNIFPSLWGSRWFTVTTTLDSWSHLREPYEEGRRPIIWWGAHTIKYTLPYKNLVVAVCVNLFKHVGCIRSLYSHVAFEINPLEVT